MQPSRNSAGAPRSQGSSTPVQGAKRDFGRGADDAVDDGDPAWLDDDADGLESPDALGWAGVDLPPRSTLPTLPSRRNQVRQKARPGDRPVHEGIARAGYTLMGIGILGMFAPAVGLQLRAFRSMNEGYFIACSLFLVIACAVVMAGWWRRPFEGFCVCALPLLVALGGLIFGVVNMETSARNVRPVANRPESRSQPPSANPANRRREQVFSLPQSQRETAAQRTARLETEKRQAVEREKRAQQEWEQLAKQPSSATGISSLGPIPEGSSAPPTAGEGSGSNSTLSTAPDPNSAEKPVTASGLFFSRPDPGRAANAGDLMAGSRIWILWGASWYPGVVVAVNGDRIRIHYDDHSDSWDEDVGVDRIRVPVSSPPVTAESAPGDAAGSPWMEPAAFPLPPDLDRDFPASQQNDRSRLIQEANAVLDEAFKKQFGEFAWRDKNAAMLSIPAGGAGPLAIHPVDTGRRFLTGANLAWNRKNVCLDTIGPVYAGAVNAQFEAKEGYAIAGLKVHVRANRVRGIRFLLQKISGQRLDPADAYESRWYGIPAAEGEATVIGGDGRKVCGLWLTQGHDILESVGLVMDLPE